jgi:hypothetical protein
MVIRLSRSPPPVSLNHNNKNNVRRLPMTVIRRLAQISLALAMCCAHSATVYNPDFLQKLPRYATSVELDRFLNELDVEAAPLPAGETEWRVFRLRPTRASGLSLLISDASGELEKRGLWLQKGKNGKFDRLVLVTPQQSDQVYAREGRIPLDAPLKKKIVSAKGLADESELKYLLEGTDTSDGKIRVRDLISRDLLGHFLADGKTWHGSRNDPAIEALRNQIVQFEGATASIANASPLAIVSASALEGSRLEVLTLP